MKNFVRAAVVVAAVGWSSGAMAQQYFLSEILTLGTNFCPVGTLPTNGALLAINQNTPLFSLLGTMYGGDGVQTFALPNTKPILTQNRAPLTQCIVTSGIFPSRP